MSSQGGEPFLGRRERGKRPLKLENLGLHQHPIPVALEKVIDEAGLAVEEAQKQEVCLLYTSPSPRD